MVGERGSARLDRAPEGRGADGAPRRPGQPGAAAGGEGCKSGGGLPVVTVPDGVKFDGLMVGRGAVAKSGMSVTGQYTGCVCDGTECDAGRRRGRSGGAGKGAGSTGARRDLAHALGPVGADQRAAVVWPYYQDRSVEETAKTLNVPVDTMKSRLKTALRRLRELTGSEEEIG